MDSISHLLDDLQVHDNNDQPLLTTMIQHSSPSSKYTNPFNDELNLPQTIARLLEEREGLDKLLLRFDASKEASAHNWKTLHEYNFDLTKILCGKIALRGWDQNSNQHIN